MGWDKLPGELRLIIHEFIYAAYKIRPRWKDRYVAAGYARVCREWQWYFELFTFKTIFLDQDRIPDFDKITERDPRRRDMVKQIHLRVRLPEYDCSVCQDEEDRETKERNNLVFTRAAQDLLAVLAKWPRRKHNPACMRTMNGGLSLDIGIQSPSDCQHGFRDFRLQDDYPICFNYDAWADEAAKWEVEKERAEQMKLKPYHDPRHGWENGKQRPVPLEARMRITEKLTLHGYLPTVWVITALSLRRQFYRGIEIPSLMKILRALPDLRYFIHEPWFNVTAARQLIFEVEYGHLIRNLPTQNKRLQNIILFQDHSQALNLEQPMNRESWPLGNRLKSLVSQSLAETTRRSDMDLVSAGFLVEAFEFFHEFKDSLPKQPNDPRIWSSLKKLYLTSDHLNPDSSATKRREVLLRAGRAAALMLSLESFALWNGGKGFSYILRYIKPPSGTPKQPLLGLAYAINVAAIMDLSPELRAVW